jgi:Arc/MetJ-type ribon-helix-helix transcriptional regulator
MPEPVIPAETEKLTISVSAVELGQIDLLVKDGFFSSRSDLIRAGMRYQLTQHDEQVHDTTERDGSR